MTASLRTRLARTAGIAALALSFALPGCGESNIGVTGPVEGKRLDGADTASKLPDATPSITSGSTAAQAQSDADARKKRDEWRDKKTGKPDAGDPLAQANIDLRPSLDPANKKPIAKADTAGVNNPTPTDPAKIPDPTALAKPLVDPTAAAPAVDPNNPNFVPADRSLYKKFDIKKLKEVDGHLVVPFADLSGFPYSGMVGAPQTDKNSKDAKAPKKPEFTIPDSIKALHGKKVVISGYMMPIDFENGGTNEFVLTRNIPSCFYCVPPQLNDWVEVKMKDGKRIDYVPDGIIELYGTIDVGELNEDGFIVNLFRMSGTKVVPMVTE
jgi:hypothetical protein